MRFWREELALVASAGKRREGRKMGVLAFGARTVRVPNFCNHHLKASKAHRNKRGNGWHVNHRRVEALNKEA
jgi:hypothetical protein